MVTGATAVLLFLVKAPAVEIVKTAGVAGGAVVALYALWLNDRKHHLESEKVADERFARSVELLGNEADQVRVGAMHALAWLARSTPRYQQTVLDVLCAYLRRPFEHPAHKAKPEDPDQDFGAVTPEIQLEHQVRLTAQRLIKDTLSWGKKRKHESYDLDLTGAVLEYFSLDGRYVNRLVARRAQFYGITNLRNVHVKSVTLFSAAEFHGRLQLENGSFTGGISFQETKFAGRVNLGNQDMGHAVVGRFFHPSPKPPDIQAGEMKVLEGTEFREPATGWHLTGSTEAAGPGLQNHVEENARGGTDGVRGDDDGLGNGHVATKADEVRAVGLEGEGLRD
nr:pentapeptide repeat-containing protein [Lentzea pudingi]